MAARLPWNRVSEVRSKGSESTAGLEYEFPCCGGTVMVKKDALDAYLAAPHDEAVNPAPDMCPYCPEVEETIKATDTPSNVVAFKKES